MAKTAGRAGRPWRRLRAQVLASSDVCWLCGLPVDRAAQPRSPMSPSVDHYVPLSKGGPGNQLANLRLAHYGCNSSRGDRMRVKSKASRQW